MKHIEKYILLLCLVFVGCTDKYSEELGLRPTLKPRYINVSPTSLAFTAESSTQGINIDAVETSWVINNVVEWINTSPAKGSVSSSVDVSVSQNKRGDEARTGVFYILAKDDDWKYKQPVSVSQAGDNPYINVAKSSVSFKGAASKEEVAVDANCDYDVSLSVVDSWLSANVKGNVLTIGATANESSEYRNGYVLLSHFGNKNIDTKVNVTQAPASINASSETLEFNNTAGKMNIEVESDAMWTASTSYSWIEVSPSRGNAGKSTMSISVAPNTGVDDRVGYVFLTVGTERRIQITVKQRGIFINTDKKEISFGASAETQNLQVLSNTSWQVSSLPSWVSVDKESGNGNSEINVIVDENPYTTERNGEFLVSQPGLSSQAVVKVNQKGKSFDIATTTLTFGDKQETQGVAVTTDGTWRAYANADWIMVSPESAKGNATLNISVADNTTDDERSSSVVVMMGDASATIAVVQKGKYFTVDNSILDFTSRGGNLGVSLTTNTDWTARVEDGVDWLKVSPAGGTGNAEAVITATDNPSVNERSANVYFDALGRNVNIKVTQKARYLTVDNNEVLFYSKGGISDPITVSTDGEFSIACNVDWLTVIRSGNVFTVSAAENNTKDARIGKIVLSLTDLTEGTYSVILTVTQLNEGGTFLRRDYDDDKDYDNNGSTIGTIEITGWGTDSNYDTNNQSGAKLTVVGYESDRDWDSSTNSSATISVTGYDSDSSFDTRNNSSGSISKGGYKGDNNWNN